jgi:tellurite resistance protein TehA-like permease
MTVPSADPRAAQRASLRRAVLHLVLGVIALDAVAMAVFYLAGIDHGPSRTRMIFVMAWSIATALLVAVLLRRVRAVRFANRR